MTKAVRLKLSTICCIFSMRHPCLHTTWCTTQGFDPVRTLLNFATEGLMPHTSSRPISRMPETVGRVLCSIRLGIMLLTGMVVQRLVVIFCGVASIGNTYA